MKRSISRTTRHLAPILMTVALSLAPLRADPANDALNALQTAMRAEIDAAAKTSTPNGRPPNSYNDGDQRIAILSQLASFAARSDGQQLDEQLPQISAYFKSPEVQVAAAKLVAQIKADRESRKAAYATQAQTVIEAIAKVVKTASKPADLDDSLASLSKVQPPDGRYGNSSEQTMRTLQTARSFLIQWQNYLSAMQNGDVKGANQFLQNTSEMEVSDIIPRSEILARITKVDPSSPKSKPGSSVLADLDKTPLTLAALPAAIDALSATLITREGDPTVRYDDDGPLLRTFLQATLRTYQNFEDGIPSDLVVYEPVGDSNRLTNPLVWKISAEPRMELLRLVLPTFFETGEQLRPNETIESYLDRLEAGATERLDAVMLCRIAEFRAKIAGRYDQGAPALQLLATARNQDEAGQFMLAVVSYEQVLQIPGQQLPTKEVGARLDEIKATHPEEYQAGVNAALAQPPRLFAPLTDRSGYSEPLMIRIPGKETATIATAPPPVGK